MIDKSIKIYELHNKNIRKNHNKENRPHYTDPAKQKAPTFSHTGFTTNKQAHTILPKPNWNI